MQPSGDLAVEQQGKPSSVRLGELGYFLRLGAAGFGGPIALAGYMQRDLVPRGWITQQEYLEGLLFSPEDNTPLATLP